MTQKSRAKKDARALQRRTGMAYQACLNIVREGWSAEELEAFVLLARGPRLVEKPRAARLEITP